jgi:hypothetical protein
MKLIKIWIFINHSIRITDIYKYALINIFSLLIEKLEIISLEKNFFDLYVIIVTFKYSFISFWIYLYIKLIIYFINNNKLN